MTFFLQLDHMGMCSRKFCSEKNKSTFTLDQGWGFPRRIYFNGDYCIMPPPDVYPWLPSASSKLSFSEAIWIIAIFIVIVIV
jgi:hypothetical protein